MERPPGYGVRWRVLFVGVALLLGSCTQIRPVSPRVQQVIFFDQVVFDANFDSGNLESVSPLDAHRFLVRPRPDFGRDGGRWEGRPARWNGHTWWYHFSVAVPPQTVPYPIELQVDLSRVRRERTYSRNKIPVTSCDGETWRYVTNWENTGHVATIRAMLTCPTTSFALATPYPWARMQRFVQSLKTAPYIAAHEIIGHTPQAAHQDALPLYYLRLMESAPAALSQANRNIVIISGQHPGEVVAPWMVTGLIRFLLSDQAQAQRLRQRFTFHLYPALNPKGVKYGHYRRSPDNPINPNRAWHLNEMREIRTVREHLLRVTGGRADYFFDLHGSTRDQPFTYYFTNQPGAAALVQAVKRRYPRLDTEIGQVTWRDTRVGRLGWHWAMKQLRTHVDDDAPPISITSEGTYSQGSWSEAPPQIEDWMAFGAALMQAVGDVESESLGAN